MLMSDGTTITRQTGLGKYEGTEGIVEFIDSMDAYDMTSGDCEAPTGWFGLAGRWIITCNSLGFVDGYRHDTREAARAEYDALEAEYADWAID